MNERELKRGLLQLSNEGWFVAEVTDDFLEGLIGRPEDPPSDEIKERCLSKLRARIQDLMRRQAGRHYDLSPELSVEIGRKSLRPRRSRKL